jgi:hypothetical protein
MTTTLEQTHASGAAIRAKNPKPNAYFTRLGLPVSIELNWPFHLSTSGADYYILHGDMKLEAEVKDGTPLHALLSVHLSQTVKEALPSLEREVCESLIINSLRKEVDIKQLEFLRTSKRQPIPVSSRFVNFKTGKFAYDPYPKERTADFLVKKVFWLGYKMAGNTPAPVWIADPYDAEYLVTTTDKLMQAAQSLVRAGEVRLKGEFAIATDALTFRAGQLIEEMKQAHHTLEAKHEFERG